MNRIAKPKLNNAMFEGEYKENCKRIITSLHYMKEFDVESKRELISMIIHIALT